VRTLQARYRPGAARRYAPHAADGSSTRGGSTSVRGQVRSPHMPKLQAASVPIPRAAARLGLGQRDGQTDGSRYRLMPPPPTAGWLGSRVVSVLDSGAEGPGFKSQPRRCRVTVLGKLFTPIVAGVTAGLAESNGSLPPGL